MRLFNAAALTLLFCNFASAQTTQLNNFDELMTALNTGESVRAVIHYGKCELIIDSVAIEAPDAIGGMEFQTFEYFAKMSIRNEKAYVTTSEAVLIGHPYYGYVYNYVKLRIYEDNFVEIIARYLDPNSYEVKMDETFTTIINNGTNEGAIYLYK
jgi:hypothetical protein